MTLIGDACSSELIGRVLRLGVTPRNVRDVFVAVFSLFVVALIVLAVLTVRWAIMRDRERRAGLEKKG